MRQLATAPDGTALLVNCETGFPSGSSEPRRIYVLYEDGEPIPAKKTNEGSAFPLTESYWWPSMAIARAAAFERYRKRAADHGDVVCLIDWRTEI